MKAGNNAVITGGAGGIGLAVAIRFAEAGMNVMIADLDAEVLDAAGDKISAVGSGNVHTQVCDVSDNAQVESLREAALQQLGAGDFYVLCPDNDTPRELDEKRIQWNTDDLILNRSALSRWDDEYQGAYEAFIDR